MKIVFIVITCVVINLALFVTGCSHNRTELSDEFAEKLNSQIKCGNFEKIYAESSKTAKESESKEEFRQRMNLAIERMRSVDSSLTFQRDDKIDMQNGDVYRDLHFVYRKIEKDGKGLNVFITLDFTQQKPNFFDLCVDNSIPSVEPTLCVTDAIKQF